MSKKMKKCPGILFAALVVLAFMPACGDGGHGGDADADLEVVPDRPSEDVAREDGQGEQTGDDPATGEESTSGDAVEDQDGSDGAAAQWVTTYLAGWTKWNARPVDIPMVDFSPIYNGGAVFPSTGGPLPCIDLSVGAYLDAGVPAAKLGFGIEFYGYVWQGVTGTQQSGFGTVRDTVPYFEIMATYGSGSLAWDEAAQAAYFSTANEFVSFDAEMTMPAKAQFLKDRGLGGVIVYEFAGGYRHDEPTPDQLLRQVAGAFLGSP